MFPGSRLDVGLHPFRIKQRILRFIVRGVINQCVDRCPEFFRKADQTVAFDAVRKNLYGLMDQAYLAKYDYSKTKEDVIDLIFEIIIHYRSMLEKEEWLSEETRKKAIEKLDNMRINAVYPDKWVDYSVLDLTGKSYPECLKAIEAYNLALDAELVNGTVDHDIWYFDILEPNAYYNPRENSINIILGLLGAPLYEPGQPKEVLMGTVGTVIGHEISHAFDPSGAQYDKDGDFSSWWTEEDSAAFQEKADKLIKYYDGITIWDGLNVSGANIQGEAVADMGGIAVLLDIAKEDPLFLTTPLDALGQFAPKRVKLWKREQRINDS